MVPSRRVWFLGMQYLQPVHNLQIDEAVKLLIKMRYKGCESWTNNGQIRVGNLDEAREFAKTLQGKQH